MENPITSFECGGCGKSYQWKSELAGKKVRCRCGHVMVVPVPVTDEVEKYEDPFVDAESLATDDNSGEIPIAGQRSSNGGIPVISALLLMGDTFPFADLKKQLATFNVLGRSPNDIRFEDGLLSFQLGDELFVLALMSAPYPWSDLEGPCATAWMWPKNMPAIGLKHHRTHLLVTMISGRSNPVRRRLMLTAVTAAAAQQPGVMGIYWGDSTMVHYPKIFGEMAHLVTTQNAPPLYLWVDYRLFRNPNGTTGLFTTGLKALGHMEIEIPSIKMPVGKLREWAMNISQYLLTNGPVLKDGNTIGMTAEQQIRIRHRPSMFGRRDMVLRMEP